jgi:hypothetical protein
VLSTSPLKVFLTLSCGTKQRKAGTKTNKKTKKDFIRHVCLLHTKKGKKDETGDFVDPLKSALEGGRKKKGKKKQKQNKKKEKGRKKKETQRSNVF